ncbi:hypothetical protein HK104_003154 [Borealophlyctis nickersoniae]|nr:hypothetical protein HK104_003154 [Borealophlyctis nickersoniae]
MASGGTGNAGAQFANLVSTFSERLKPLGANVGKQLTHWQQYAKERMGSTQDVTELPAEYRELEEKVDKIRLLHENLLKIARNYTLPHYDYQPALKDTVFDFASTVQDRATSLAATGAKAAGVQTTLASGPPGKREEIAPSLTHAFARAAYQSVEALGTQEPLGAALKKFSAVEEKVGNARLKMDAEANAKFVQPFTTTLNQTIGHAMKARRNVQSIRLTYDACRAKLKSAKPEHVEAARIEMEAAEDEFVAAVDDAMGKMKVVVESPEPLKNLADLVAAQLAYFKVSFRDSELVQIPISDGDRDEPMSSRAFQEAYEVLAEISPEIDELQVTNEALLRHPTS